jgi:hypothetical protein
MITFSKIVEGCKKITNKEDENIENVFQEIETGDRIKEGESLTKDFGLTLGVGSIYKTWLRCSYTDTNHNNKSETLDVGEGFNFIATNGDKLRMTLVRINYDSDDEKKYAVFKYDVIETKIRYDNDDENSFTKLVKYQGTFLDEKFGTGFRIENFNPKGTQNYIKGDFVVNGTSTYVELYKNEFWPFEVNNTRYVVTIDLFEEGRYEGEATMKIRRIIDKDEIKIMTQALTIKDYQFLAISNQQNQEKKLTDLGFNFMSSNVMGEDYLHSKSNLHTSISIGKENSFLKLSTNDKSIYNDFLINLKNHGFFLEKTQIGDDGFDKINFYLLKENKNITITLRMTKTFSGAWFNEWNPLGKLKTTFYHVDFFNGEAAGGELRESYNK